MKKIVILSIVLLAWSASAEEKKAPRDEKAYMEAMMKAATPGEQHKHLAALAGSWEFTMKMWMDPSKDPIESKGTSESKVIMDGRYLEEKVTGDFGGMKFQGQALHAYDNLQKKYIWTWIDNFGTGVSVASGSYDADKKALTYKGEEVDPLDGKKIKNKSVIHLIDKDKYEVDMYKVIDGKDVKVMHLDVTRKAAK